MPPHVGGVGRAEVPETALTAIVVEALRESTSPEARRAVARGRAFLRRQKFGPDTPGWLDPTMARGAFAASPIASILRCDISGHALLALRGAPDEATV
jgi:hypothetical protein